MPSQPKLGISLAVAVAGWCGVIFAHLGLATACSGALPVAPADAASHPTGQAEPPSHVPWPARGDCPASQTDWYHGMFWLRDAADPSKGCIARGVADCGWSDACREFGYCALRPEGHCSFPKTEPCASQPFCAKNGGCHFAHGRCQPANDADCAASELCKRRGLCHFYQRFAEQAECIANQAEDCLQSTRCAEEGACTLVHQTCRPTDSLDCQDHDVCRLGGRCVFVADEKNRLNNDCAAPTDWACRTSAWCKERGQCARLRAECVPAGDEDCQRSTWCQTKGLCKHHTSLRRCVRENDFAGAGRPTAAP